mmetsp:Transcript_15970/g.47985  ORF Transcript_15970/g.47985 Transcript_15970/m.47985 type:complete len:139 (-) Transcript_15970:585-1001(-)
MAASSKAAQTAQRWYQTKRIPLYVVVGCTVTAAATYVTSHGTHPSVQTNKEMRMNSLHETEGAGADAHLAYVEGEHPGGATTQGSPGRKAIRGTGLLKGQETSGILPNNAIADKLRDVVGHEHEEHKEILDRKRASQQ